MSNFKEPIISNIYNIGNDDKYILVSDEHLGNIKENISYIRMVNLFANYNKINGIIHGGDLLEGLFDGIPLKYDSYEKQLCHFIDDYPKNESIKNYLLYGNHDINFINKGYNLNHEISKRKDFISIGELSRFIKIKNGIFFLKHTKEYLFKSDNSPLTFKGHSHKYKNDSKKRAIYIPALSDDSTNEMKSYPGFLVLEVIDDIAYVTHYVITDEPHKDETVNYKIKKLGSVH